MTPAYAEPRPRQAAQHADDRGLARPVRPKETEDRTLGHGKRNMIHRREMPKAFGQCFAGGHGFHGIVEMRECQGEGERDSIISVATFGRIVLSASQ